MKTKKYNLFQLVNSVMAVFCVGTVWMNHVGVSVLNSDTATSSVNGNTFEYTTSDNSLVFKKNGDLIGFLPTDKKLKFVNDNPILNFNSNAIGVGIAALAGTAMNAGAALGTVAGAAVNGAAALAEVPGAAIVEATLGGAGVAAAEAAAAAGAMTATEVIAAAVIPMLGGAIVFAGVA